MRGRKGREGELGAGGQSRGRWKDTGGQVSKGRLQIPQDEVADIPEI